MGRDRRDYRIRDRRTLPDSPLRKHRRALAAIIRVLAVGAGITLAVIGEVQLQKRGTDIAHGQRERVADLRAGCRRTSQRTAANVNLNWLYYQSERLLVSQDGAQKTLLPAIHRLSAGEQSFLLALIRESRSSPYTSRFILQARADADYNAAFVNASQIDVADVRLVNLHTMLGSGVTPRRWVLKARFSCDKAYP